MKQGITTPDRILRSDVALFASDYAQYVSYRDFPDDVQKSGGLRVMLASPNYLLAMKILSMRNPAYSHDCRDIWELLDLCSVKNMDEAKNVVTQFYPRKIIPFRHEMILKDIFAYKQEGKPYSGTVGW